MREDMGPKDIKTTIHTDADCADARGVVAPVNQSREVSRRSRLIGICEAGDVRHDLLTFDTRGGSGGNAEDGIRDGRCRHRSSRSAPHIVDRDADDFAASMCVGMVTGYFKQAGIDIPGHGSGARNRTVAPGDRRGEIGCDRQRVGVVESGHQRTAQRCAFNRSDRLTGCSESGITDESRGGDVGMRPTGILDRDHHILNACGGPGVRTTDRKRSVARGGKGRCVNVAITPIDGRAEVTNDRSVVLVLEASDDPAERSAFNRMNRDGRRIERRIGNGHHSRSGEGLAGTTRDGYRWIVGCGAGIGVRAGNVESTAVGIIDRAGCRRRAVVPVDRRGEVTLDRGSVGIRETNDIADERRAFNGRIHLAGDVDCIVVDRHRGTGGFAITHATDADNNVVGSRVVIGVPAFDVESAATIRSDGGVRR